MDMKNATLTAAEKRALQVAAEHGIVSNHGGYNVSRVTLRNLRQRGLLVGGVDVVTCGSGRSGQGRSVTYCDSYGSLTDAGRAALEVAS
jgi:hypothetical protein